MKVYVLLGCNYDGSVVHAVFASEAGAEQAKAAQQALIDARQAEAEDLIVEVFDVQP